MRTARSKFLRRMVVLFVMLTAMRLHAQGPPY